MTGEHQPSDEEVSRLVQAARAGDADAFDALVMHFGDRVYGVAWQLSHSREDALDITQEAFVRAWRALASYQGSSRFQTWLHRIVLNTGIDYIRRETRHRQPGGAATADEPSSPETVSWRPDSDAAHHEPSVGPAQRELVYEKQLQARVLDALAQLSRRQRQIFVLRYYHGLSMKEMAEIIQSSEGTVKRHLSRAQGRLRELLADLRVRDRD